MFGVTYCRLGQNPFSFASFSKSGKCRSFQQSLEIFGGSGLGVAKTENAKERKGSKNHQKLTGCCCSRWSC